MTQQANHTRQTTTGKITEQRRGQQQLSKMFSGSTEQQQANRATGKSNNRQCFNGKVRHSSAPTMTGQLIAEQNNSRATSRPDAKLLFSGEQ
jgi:hypothetical protein